MWQRDQPDVERPVSHPAAQRLVMGPGRPLSSWVDEASSCLSEATQSVAGSWLQPFPAGRGVCLAELCFSLS